MWKSHLPAWTMDGDVSGEVRAWFLRAGQGFRCHLALSTSLSPLPVPLVTLMARRAPSSKKQGGGEVCTVCFLAATGNADLGPPLLSRKGESSQGHRGSVLWPEGVAAGLWGIRDGSLFLCWVNALWTLAQKVTIKPGREGQLLPGRPPGLIHKCQSS